MSKKPFPLKIALFHNLPHGGAKRAMYEHVKRLSKNHMIDLYTFSSTDKETHFCSVNEFVRKKFLYNYKLSSTKGINVLKYYMSLFGLYSINKKIAMNINSKDYDLVFVHHCKWTQTPPILRYLKKPVVYCCQEPPRIFYEEALIQNIKRTTLKKIGYYVLSPLFILNKYLDKKNAKVEMLVLANSFFSAESIARIYGVRSRVCYLGVDTEKFHPINNIKKDDFVLSVGKIGKSKGYDFLINSIALIEDDSKPNLVLAYGTGNSNEKKQLANLAEEKNVLVEFKENISDNELLRLYNTAKLVVYAPYLEPFGFVSLEAMACGTPVIGIKEGGVREAVIDGKTGYLIEREEKLFAEAISKLLNDDEKRRQFGINARKYVETNWNWNKSTERLENLIFEYLKMRKR